MSPKTCPQCGKKAEGSFCSWCGAALATRFCTQCGAQLEAGARFCNQCGTRLGESGETGGSGPEAGTPARPGRGGGTGSPTGSLAWWIAGGAMVALILIIAYPVIRQADVAPDGSMAPAAGDPAGGGASSVDIMSMTPREAADSLFNRVMRAASAGDSAQVAMFLPMSIQAYDRARPLDADGLFHKALLQQTGGDFEGSLTTAREALDENPDHLLNLAMAAQAAHAMGDDAVATELYRRLVDVWDEERARELPEYVAHDGMLPGLRQEALDYLNR